MVAGNEALQAMIARSNGIPPLIELVSQGSRATQEAAASLAEAAAAAEELAAAREEQLQRAAEERAQELQQEVIRATEVLHPSK